MNISNCSLFLGGVYHKIGLFYLVKHPLWSRLSIFFAYYEKNTTKQSNLQGGVEDDAYFFANLANAFSTAAMVFSISSSVWEVDKNNPSNCDGGKKIPSSIIVR